MMVWPFSTIPRPGIKTIAMHREAYLNNVNQERPPELKEKTMTDDMYELEDGFYCDACGELIEDNEYGLAVIFVNTIRNEVDRELNFIHASDHCKQLVRGNPMGNWSKSL